MTKQISFGGGISEAPAPDQQYLRQRAMSQALIGGSQGPISGWGEGVGNLAKTAAGVFLGRKADAGEKATNEARRAALQGVLSSSDPMAALSQSSDPELQGMALNAQMAKLLKDPKDADLVQAVGQDGQMHWVDKTQAAGMQSALPKDAALPGAVQEFEYGQQHPDFNQWTIDQKKAGANNTSVTVQAAGDKKNAETVGDYWGKKLGTVLDAGFNAPVTIAKYKQLGGLLDQVGTGTFAQSGIEFKKALKGAGIDPESLGISDNTAPADAAESIINQLTLEMRNPAGGAGMPGAMSDSDRNFLAAIPPGISKTPGGNAMIIQARVKMAQRDADVGKMANDYASKHGGLIDGGFYDQLQQWSEAHPLFADLTPPASDGGDEVAPTATGPNGQKLILRNGQWVPQ